MRPRVLFLEVLPTIAGGQQVLIDLLANGGRFDAHVLLPAEGPFAAAVRGAGASSHVAPMGQYTLVHKTWRDVGRYAVELPRLAWKTAQLADQTKADLIYANSGRAFLWGTLGGLLSQRPVVWHVHNMVGDRKTLTAMRLFARLPAVHRLICVCQAARAQFPGAYGKSAVIYNGIDTASFCPTPRQRQSARAELDIPDQAFAVGVVGDLTPHKGQDVVLQALREIAASSTPWVALIIGEERPNEESRRYVTNLQSLADRMPEGCRAVFTGRRRDMVRMYSAMDSLVVASTASETTSLVLQEAMACGIPVIASRTGGIAEMIEPATDGFLYKPGDIDALASYLKLLATDPALRQVIGTCARETAERRFDVDRMRRQTRDELVEVLSRASGTHSIHP